MVEKTLLDEISKIAHLSLEKRNILVVSDRKGRSRERRAFLFYGTDDFNQTVRLADQYNKGRRIVGVYRTKITTLADNPDQVVIYVTVADGETKEYKKRIKELAEKRAKMTPEERSA